MIGLLNDLIDALREAAAAAWPEAAANGIWEGEEALQRSFDQQLTLPYAVIDLSAFEPTADWGVGNRMWVGSFGIYYIAETEGDSTDLRQKLEMLSDQLDTTPLTTGQVVSRPVRMAYGRDMEMNSLLILLNATQRAGAVLGSCIVGWTPG